MRTSIFDKVFFDFVEKPLRWRISANDECELYEFSLHTIRELHTNHKLRITNREYALYPYEC